MSETLSQDPESLGTGSYGLAPNYPPTPATPSSTVQDPPGSNLPPFSTFSADMDTATGFSTDRFLSDTRLLDISNWDYYPETRILDRSENGLSIISSQPQYRPWESKPVDSTSQQGFAQTTPVTTFADAFTQNGVSKLPSFQSQFQTYNEAVTTSEPTLTTLTNLTPVSPNSSSPTLTTLNSNFHTLSAVNPRNYPLVPAPIQAREIPSIQQQFLDERHIQLYTHPTANIASLNPPPGSIFQSQNGAILQNSQLIGSPTVVTVIKSEPDLKLTTLSPQDMKIQNLHPTQFQNPMTTILDNNLYNGLDKKLNGINATASSPTRNDFRKKERRKIRASSLESSAESDGASSNMDLGSESSGQVAAVSSTASFKTHHAMAANSSLDVDDISGGGVDKQVKKKRKRCGECIGCQRKDNCGDCAPCRNDKSHQICKQRRCEKLTEKKSYRGRKPSGPVSLSNSSVPENSVPSSRPSPQPVHMLKPEQPVQQQPMAPMPFYADPTRFTAPVWQAEPAQTWSQGQFIQQIPASAQPALEAYPPQQYPNGIYQTTYQQPGFETNTFYTGAVQVLTNTRPPSAPDHSQLTSRTNGSYSHTPSPVPSQPQQQQGTPRSNISGQYHPEYNQGYVAPSTPTGNVDNSSRPSSVNSVVNAPATNPNFQQQPPQQAQGGGGFTSVSTNNFSPGSNANPNYANANSGNEKPGYPQVNSNPQLVSHSSSGYPGSQYGGGNMQQTQPPRPQPEQQTQQWPVSSENMMWEPNIASGGKPISMEQHDVVQQQYNHSEHPNEPGDQYSQANRVELNSRIKTMILNKHHSIVGDRKHEEDQQQQQQSQQQQQQQQQQHDNENKTGHFLWYSHHHRPPDILGDGGGVPFLPRTPQIIPPTDNTDKSRQESYRTVNTKTLPQKSYETAVNQKSNELSHCPREISKKASDILQTGRERLNGMHFNKNLINQLENRGINVDNPTPTCFNGALGGSHQLLRPPSAIDHKQNQHLRTQREKPINPSVFSGNCSVNQNQVPVQPTTSLQHPTVKIEPQIPTAPANEADKFNGIHLNGSLINHVKVQNGVMENQDVKNRLNMEQQKSPEDVKPTSKISGTEIPCCTCFPPDRLPPEPGSYYTHLGCSSSLVNLRKDLEKRTGVNGKAIRIEKVKYAGKEGKTPQGCPLAKWIIRRSSYDEKYLAIVKHRQGHSCVSTYIVICIVAWDGIGQTEADNVYTTLTDKLNKYGLPTNRRCATNEQRTCACQGLDPKTCGASFSFGCSWSMYYNGCKFARSKIVRKFRLAEKSEEQAMENRLQNLVTFLTPLYKTLAPESYKNQCIYEKEALDCRLGSGSGRPFSGVTVCMDFCAHTHKDSHNMNNGCTMVVTLTKEKKLTKPDEEQLHVLPLYTIDSTDEFGSKECQDAKMKMGSIEVLNKYECEVRIRTVPLQPCRRRKKKDDDNHTPVKKEHATSNSSMSSSGYESSRSQTPRTPIKNIDTPTSLLQSNHVSSTVTDSPLTSRSWPSEGFLDYSAEYDMNGWFSNGILNGANPEAIHYNNLANHNHSNSMNNVKYSPSVLSRHPKHHQDNTAFALTYPMAHHHHHQHLNHNSTATNNNHGNKDNINTKCKGTSQPAQSNLTQNKVQDSLSGITRNTNHSSVNNTTNSNHNNPNHNNHNFGITGNVYNTSKSGDTYKFHYNPGPVNSSPISPFKVPFTPESPIRPVVSNGFVHHNNFYKPMGMMNQFGRVDNAGYDNFFRAGAINPYSMTSYPNHFHTGYHQYNTFNPSYSLAHQFFPQNLNFEPKIPRPNPISEAAFYQHHQYNKNYTQQADIKPSLPPFHFFNNSQNINPNTYHLCNPFDDVGDYGLKKSDAAPQSFDFADPLYLPHWQYPKPWEFTPTTLTENTESLGKVIDIIDNAEAFMDSQIGGVAIALTHGSVLFECAKHELHATTALKKPNRLAPTRISLVFYQHRNLNAAKHGWDQWEEKTRLKKLNSSNESNDEKFNFDLLEENSNLKMLVENNNEIMLRAPTLTTMSVTTLFPMYPCVVTGPYQKHNHSD